MKKLLLLPIFSLAFIACNKDEEPLKVEVANKTSDFTLIEQFKNSIADRPVVMGMHYGWGTKTGYSLVNTPDSLDIVILKENFENPTDLMIKDLKDVQNLKKTKVLTSVDLQSASDAAEKSIKNRFKAEKKALMKKWADEGTKPESKEEVDAAVEQLKQKINEEEVAKAEGYLKGEMDKIATYFNEIGYNGMSVRFPQNQNIYTKEMLEADLAALTGKAGKGKNFMFVVESPNEDYIDIINQANYVVGYNPKIASFSAFMNESEKFSEVKYLPSFSVNDANLKKGFGDYPYFSANVLPKDEALLNFQTANYGGVAVYHSESYYYVTADYEGYVNPYIPLKVYINAVMNKNK